jgi:hypothetical protein
MITALPVLLSIIAYKLLTMQMLHSYIAYTLEGRFEEDLRGWAKVIFIAERACFPKAAVPKIGI